MISYSTSTGNLIFTADDESRIELLDHAEDYQRQFYLVLEDVCGNGLETVPPEAIGALTNSEIFSEDVEQDEGGDVTAVGRVYWFPDYMIQNPWEILAKTGQVVFTGVD